MWTWTLIAQSTTPSPPTTSHQKHRKLLAGFPPANINFKHLCNPCSKHVRILELHWSPYEPCSTDLVFLQALRECLCRSLRAAYAPTLLAYTQEQLALMLTWACAHYDFAGPYCLPITNNEQLGFEPGSHNIFWKEVQVWMITRRPKF